MTDTKKNKSKFRRFFLNKYILVLIPFLLIITFFDEHSLIRRWESHQRIAGMKNELKFYQDEIDKSKQKKRELQSNNENLEKFAREQYYMKRKNEDIYVVKDDDDDQKNESKEESK